MVQCQICKDEILKDNARIILADDPSLQVCMQCDPRLGEKVKVLKLTIEGLPGNWMAFPLEEDCRSLPEEILEIIHEGDTPVLEVVEMTRHEVLRLGEFMGW